MSRNNPTSILLVFIVVFSLIPACAYAGQFRVSPIKLFFDKSTKSGAVSVINEGSTPLKFQVELAQWTQDEEGNDVYTESSDLQFFPKILTVEGGETRIIRTGVKFPAVKEEQTYRLFIRELPEKPQTDGVTIAIAVRFGVPIFIKPLAVSEGTSIESVSMEEGKLAILLKNPGNVHFKIDTIKVKGTDAAGKEQFSKSIEGWYLLTSASRLYTVEIPKEVCASLAAIQIEVDTDHADANKKFPVDSGMCPQ